MKQKKNFKQNNSKAHFYRFTVGRILQLVVALVFLLFIGRFIYIGISNNVAGQNLSERTQQLYRRNEVLKANRGSIYDRNGMTIAEDSHKYTVYAILDKSSIDYHGKPMYVVDKEKTAEKLAKVLPMSQKHILSYLNPKHAAYQVEFGSGGAGLTLNQKKQINNMNLKGIKFVETPARLYLNGEFASHVIGLTQIQGNKKNDTQDLVGNMGIEEYFNKQLSGKDGYQEASVDADNYQLPNSAHAFREAEDGDSFYLTLDSQLQIYLENLLNGVQSKYEPKSLTAIVEDVKSGQILAATQRPTFNPSTQKGLDSNWRNILVQDSFEPGSVFKIISMTSAIQNGNYNPNEPYKSGSITLDGSTIHDWNTTGWGSIPLSQAFPRSSNVGMATLEQKMGNQTWKEYLDKFGIGKKTGVTLPGETPGILNIKSNLDGAVTSFGQGVNVNTMQMMQVYSSLANNGQMLKPQFVKKIVSSSGKTISTFHKEKVGKPIYSKDVAKTTLQLMQDVVNAKYGTGIAYKMPGKSIAVKTGTAQVAGPKGGYLTGASDYIFSVVGLTPANNPRYCVYLTMQQPRKMTEPAETILASIFKPLMNRLITINDAVKTNEKVDVPQVINLPIEEAKEKISSIGLVPIILGEGKSIANQATTSGIKIVNGSQIFLFTGGKFKCPDMKNWTSEDIANFGSATGVSITTSGKGKVNAQSLPANQEIDQSSKLHLELKE